MIKVHPKDFKPGMLVKETVVYHGGFKPRIFFLISFDQIVDSAQVIIYFWNSLRFDPQSATCKKMTVRFYGNDYCQLLGDAR